MVFEYFSFLFQVTFYPGPYVAYSLWLQYLGYTRYVYLLMFTLMSISALTKPRFNDWFRRSSYIFIHWPLFSQKEKPRLTKSSCNEYVISSVSLDSFKRDSTVTLFQCWSIDLMINRFLKMQIKVQLFLPANFAICWFPTNPSIGLVVSKPTGS